MQTQDVTFLILILLTAIAIGGLVIYFFKNFETSIKFEKKNKKNVSKTSNSHLSANQHRENINKRLSNYSWELSRSNGGVKISPFATHYPRFQISLFQSHQFPARNRFIPYELGIFCLASFPSENNEILIPITRKILSKYRDTFDKKVNIMMHPQFLKRTIYTWLSSELEIYAAASGILDELLKLNQNFTEKPQLHIQIGEKILIGVAWTDLTLIEHTKYFQQTHPLLELIMADDFFSVSLIIGVNSNHLQLLRQTQSSENATSADGLIHTPKITARLAS